MPSLINNQVKFRRGRAALQVAPLGPNVNDRISCRVAQRFTFQDRVVLRMRSNVLRCTAARGNVEWQKEQFSVRITCSSRPRLGLEFPSGGSESFCGVALTCSCWSMLKPQSHHLNVVRSKLVLRERKKHRHGVLQLKTIDASTGCHRWKALQWFKV